MSITLTSRFEPVEADPNTGHVVLDFGNPEILNDFVAMLNQNKVRNARGELISFRLEKGNPGHAYLWCTAHTDITGDEEKF